MKKKSDCPQTKTELNVEPESLAKTVVADIFDDLNEGIASVSLTGNVIAVNRALCELLNMSKEQLIGRNILSLAAEILSAREINKVLPHLKSLISGQSVIPFHFKFRNKVLEISTTFNRDRKYLIGIVRDITDSKQKDEALRESENHFRVLVETVGEGIIFQDASGAIIHWNKAAEDIFNIKAENIVGHKSTDRDWDTVREDGSPFPGSDHPSMQTLKTGEPRSNVIMGIKRASGDITWITANTRPLFREGDKSPYGVAISFSDITESINARAEIGRLAQIVDIAPSSITIHDLKGNTLYANECTFKMHGYEKEEFMKINLRHLDVPESRDLIESRLHEVMETGEAEFEAEHYRKDGSTFPLQVYVKKIEWSNEPALLSIASDISERKHAEAELLKLNTALEAQVKERIAVDAFTLYNRRLL